MSALRTQRIAWESAVNLCGGLLLCLMQYVRTWRSLRGGVVVLCIVGRYHHGRLPLFPVVDLISDALLAFSAEIAQAFWLVVWEAAWSAA